MSRWMRHKHRGNNWDRVFPSAPLLFTTLHSHRHSSFMHFPLHVQKGYSISLSDNCGVIFCVTSSWDPPTPSPSKQGPGKWEWAEQQDEQEKREEDRERQETGKRKHNPMDSLLISNGNIWKCTLSLAKHTLDRGQANSEKRQNGGKM